MYYSRIILAMPGDRIRYSLIYYRDDLYITRKCRILITDADILAVEKFRRTGIKSNGKQTDI